MSRREFHFSEGSSNKFWAITVDGKEFTVEFGRLGTTGQTQTKKFSSDAAARQGADKLIAEKTKKGYQEVGDTSSPAPHACTAPAERPRNRRPSQLNRCRTGTHDDAGFSSGRANHRARSGRLASSYLASP